MFTNIYYDEYKGKMHLWEINQTTKKVNHIVEDHEVEYYVKDDTNTSKIRDIYGTRVVKRVADSRKSLRELRKSNVETFESDISEEVKFLHKRYKDIDFKPNPKDYKIANIDIEIQCANEFPKPELAKYPINLITVDFYRTDEIVTLGLNEYHGQLLNKPGFRYIYCESEEILLTKFCELIKKEKTQAITGWNIGGFDIPYICNRIENLGIQDQACLSYLGRVIKKRNGTYQIPGLALLDLMELYKKFSYQNQPSYSLNYIGLQEVGEGKLDFEGQINDLWDRDWDLFVDYNVQDTALVRKIEFKRKFVDLVINLCTQTRTPFEKVYSTISIVEGYMLRYLHKVDMVFSDRKIDFDEDEDEETIEGGHVEAFPGFYNFVLSIDATSEYPSLVRMMNISPETKVCNPTEEDIVKYNLIKAHTPGLYYKREQGIIPKIVTDIFNERKKFKALMEEASSNKNYELEEYYDSQQLIRKILINSVYGCLAQKYFHFFDLDNAAEVTLGGRTAIQYIANCINTYFSGTFPKIAKKYYPNTDLTVGDIPEKIVKVIDTDSVTGNSIISTDNGNITISSLYDSSYDKIEVSKNNFKAKLKDVNVLSFNTEEFKTNYGKALYIKKHLVKKRMFRITCNDKTVTVTEDHSIIVKRNGEYVAISAKNIVRGDKIIYVN